MDFNIKCKITKLLERDTGKILWDPRLVEGVLDLIPIAWSMKRKSL